MADNTDATHQQQVAWVDLLPMIVDPLTLAGSIMGTLDDMQDMMNLIVRDSA